MKTIKAALLVSFALILMPSSIGIFGQAGTGSIVGTVYDSTGAVVPNGSITIRNEGTNTSRTVVTSASGDYSAPLLLPGSYEVSTGVIGFSKTVYRNVQLQV